MIGNNGMVMPHHLGTEESIVGGCLLVETAILALPDLQPDFFYTPALRIAYRGIKDLSAKGTPVNIATLVSHLRSTGELDAVGGAYYLSSISEGASFSNLKSQGLRVTEDWIKRESIKIGPLLLKGYQDGQDCWDLLDEIQNRITEITQAAIRGKKAVKVGDVLQERLSDLEERGKGKPPGILGPWREENKIINGRRKGTVAIIGARPAMGKTSKMMQEAAWVSRSHPVAVFSLEMPYPQIVDRMIVSESGVDNERFDRGIIERDENEAIQKAVSVLEKLPIYIDDTPAITTSELRNRVRILKAKYKIEAVYLDYIQIMGGDNNSKQNRDRFIASIMGDLLSIAKDEDVAIVALSQLSRDCEKRQDKRPLSSDLRDGGAIEQDAYSITMLYRDEVYKIEKDEHGNSTAGLAEAIITKNRGGRIGTVMYKFKGSTYTFDDISTEDSPPKFLGSVADYSEPQKQEDENYGAKKEDAPF